MRLMVTYPHSKASIKVVFEHLFISSCSYIGSNGIIPVKSRGVVMIVDDKLVQDFILTYIN